MNGRSSQRERPQEPTVQEQLNQQVQQLQQQGYEQIGYAMYNDHMCRVFQNDEGAYRAVREDNAYLYRSSSFVRDNIAPLAGRSPVAAEARAEEERTGAGGGAAGAGAGGEQARAAPVTGTVRAAEPEVVRSSGYDQAFETAREHRQTMRFPVGDVNIVVNPRQLSEEDQATLIEQLRAIREAGGSAGSARECIRNVDGMAGVSFQVGGETVTFDELRRRSWMFSPGIL